METPKNGGVHQWSNKVGKRRARAHGSGRNVVGRMFQNNPIDYFQWARDAYAEIVRDVRKQALADAKAEAAKAVAP